MNDDDDDDKLGRDGNSRRERKRHRSGKCAPHSMRRGRRGEVSPSRSQSRGAKAARRRDRATSSTGSSFDDSDSEDTATRSRSSSDWSSDEESHRTARQDGRRKDDKHRIGRPESRSRSAKRVKRQRDALQRPVLELAGMSDNDTIETPPSLPAWLEQACGVSGSQWMMSRDDLEWSLRARTALAAAEASPARRALARPELAARDGARERELRAAAGFGPPRIDRHAGVPPTSLALATQRMPGAAALSLLARVLEDERRPPRHVQRSTLGTAGSVSAAGSGATSMPDAARRLVGSLAESPSRQSALLRDRVRPRVQMLG